MKLKKEFLQHITDNEAMLVPTGRAGFAGLVRGNRTLGVILGLLAEETTEDAVIAAMKARFDAPEEILTRDVRTALQNLRAVGALDE